MRAIRGKESDDLPEPMTSLNPVYTCGEIIETLVLHEKMDPRTRAPSNARLWHPPLSSASTVPAPDVGRHAAARADRDGARVPAVDPDRRRAHHRARRHDQAQIANRAFSASSAWR
jgi:ABC-type dipeptide/oligopeptide/nickel transport system ATPase component